MMQTYPGLGQFEFGGSGLLYSSSIGRKWHTKKSKRW